jgi:hypothetical protein
MEWGGNTVPRQIACLRNHTLEIILKMVQKCATLAIRISKAKFTLKGLSHEIDFKNLDQTLKNLT